MLEVHPERTVELTSLSRDDRERLRPWVVIGLVLAVGMILLIIGVNAHAQDVPLHVLDKDGIEIRLLDKPCVDPLSVSMIRPDAVHRFRAVQSVWPQPDGSRKEFAGCWAELTAKESGGEDGFLVVFSDGESGFIPKAEFKKVRGQVGA